MSGSTCSHSGSRDHRLLVTGPRPEKVSTIRLGHYVFEVQGRQPTPSPNTWCQDYKNIRDEQCRRIAGSRGGATGGVRYPADPKATDAKSPRNYNRDLYECERQATFADVGTKQQVFDNCMKARGYKEK